MNKSSFILYIRYLCVVLFISVVMLFVFGNYVITNAVCKFFNKKSVQIVEANSHISG